MECHYTTIVRTVGVCAVEVCVARPRHGKGDLLWQRGYDHLSRIVLRR